MSATIINVFVHSHQYLTVTSTPEIRLLLSWDSELLTSWSSSPKVKQRLFLFQMLYISQACNNSNLHVVQAGNLRAVDGGQLPRLLVVTAPRAN